MIITYSRPSPVNPPKPFQKSNPSGSLAGSVGASVAIEREVKSGGSYQSHSDFRLHFGLGSADLIDEIAIRWPTGKVQRLTRVKANQILTIKEPTV